MINQGTTPVTADYNTSKTVIDKISGKRAIHTRYTTGNVPGPHYADGIEEHNKVPGQDKLFENIIKRPPSNLDKYIELILKGVTNVDEFIYLLRNDKNDDPYDLIVIDYSDLKKKQEDNLIKEYYTISMKGLTHYVGGRPIEFISLAYWLKERDTYDRIKSLSFFVKFRKWKTLKMWIRNVTRHKVSNYKKSLEEKLFILHPVLQETLKQHRKLCCEMEELRFVDLTQQVEVQKLKEFAENQEKKRKFVNERVQEISKRARENVRAGFKECLDQLRKKKSSAPIDDDFTKKESQPNMVRLKENAYENLGFPENMSYEKRSELRKECSRFIRFSYLVDFLALESLSNVYTNSIKDLIFELEGLNKDIFIDAFKGDQQAAYRGSKFKDPLFLVQLDFNNTELIPEDQVDWIEINRYEPAAKVENLKPYEFDIIAHVYIIEEVDVNDPKLDELDIKRMKDEKEALRRFEQRIPRNIHEKRVAINPNLESIFSTILRCFQEGMNSLQAFERWSKHDELTDYASVLEEWDDMVGDDWEIPESNFLNPHSWIKPTAFNDYGTQVKELLEISFKKAYEFIASLNYVITLEWRNSQIDYDVYKSEKLITPYDTFKHTFQLLDW